MGTKSLIAFCLACVSMAVFASTTVQAQEKKKPPKITYDDHVKEIMHQKCFSCHNPDKKSGDLDLTSYTNLMLGGGSGEVIEPGDSSSSYLYELVSHAGEPYMPPEQPKIPDEMIETIRKWIDGGVLENSGSKAMVSDKPKLSLALSEAPTERPKVAPLPPLLSLEPVRQTKTTTAVTALATSPWSPIVAVGGQNQVLLYNTQTLQLVGVLPFSEGIPEVLKFSRNGSLLLAGGGRGGASGKAIVWNVRTGERIIEIGDELDAVLAADISADQTLIALGGPQRVVRIYSTETGRLMHELRKHTNWIYSLEFSPDSVLLASGDRNGGLLVWEAWTGREYLTLKGHGAGVTGVSWRLDSNALVSCSQDGTIRLWEMENGAQIRQWAGHGGGVASVEFARNGRLVSAGRDRTTKIWQQDGKQLRAFEAFSDYALEVSICDETDRVISGDWSGEIRIWNAADGKRIGNLVQNPPALVTRLESANTQLTALQATSVQLAKVATATKSAADEVVQRLDKATKEMNAAKTIIDQKTAMQKTVDAKLKAATAALDVATKSTVKLGIVVPTLAELAQKAAELSKKAADDKEVAKIAADTKAISETRSKQLAASQQEKAKQTTAMQQSTAELKKVQMELAAAQTAYTTAKAMVDQLTPQVKPMQDKAVAAKKANDDGNAQVTQATQQRDHWQTAISFAKQLTVFEKQKQDSEAIADQRRNEAGEALTALAAAETLTATANQKRTTAQKGLTDAEKALADGNAKVEQSTKAIADLVVQDKTTKDRMAELNKILTPLIQAAAQTKLAVDNAPKDEGLAAVQKQLQEQVTAKQGLIKTAQTEVATYATTMAARQVQLEKEKIAVPTYMENRKKAETGLQVATKAMEPFVATEGKAKQVVADVKKKVDEADAVTAGVAAKIAVLKGIAQK